MPHAAQQRGQLPGAHPGAGVQLLWQNNSTHTTIRLLCKFAFCLCKDVLQGHWREGIASVVLLQSNQRLPVERLKNQQHPAPAVQPGRKRCFGAVKQVPNVYSSVPSATGQAASAESGEASGMGGAGQADCASAAKACGGLEDREDWPPRVPRHEAVCGRHKAAVAAVSGEKAVPDP